MLIDVVSFIYRFRYAYQEPVVIRGASDNSVSNVTALSVALECNLSLK